MLGCFTFDRSELQSLTMTKQMSKNEPTVNQTFQFTNVRNQYLAVVTGKLINKSIRIFRRDNWLSAFSFSAANFLQLANGCALCWPVQFLPQFQSIDTPLVSGPLTSDEISWVMGISYIGSLLSLICNGFFLSFVGSKRFLLSATVSSLVERIQCYYYNNDVFYSSQVPMVIFWWLIHSATDFHHILLARFISGWTNSTIYLALILFSVEVANDK